MANVLRLYKIKENRLKKSFLSGFEISGKNAISTDTEGFRHVFVCTPIDGEDTAAEWGRIKFDYTMQGDMVLTVYCFASDYRDVEKYLFSPDVSLNEKKRLLENNDSCKIVNSNDMLLFSQKGRYLYIMIDISGRGQASISDIKIFTRSELVMELMPEVYRDNDFLSRYLSIYTSMFHDFQEKINHVDELLDVDRAPVEFLPVLAHWMGIDVSGDFLEEDRLRTLVREAYSLNKMKGTKAAFERVTEIVLGEKAIVLEKNVMREYSQIEDAETYDKLYGDRTYDVTMLIKTYVPENQKSQMVFLLKQFKPVRCRLLIRFLDGSGEVDKHSYLDMNACVQNYAGAMLDSRQGADEMILLQE